MIQMEPRHLNIVMNILSKYPYQFYAFGSRVTGNPRRFSDLDLCYKEPIPGNIIVHIEEDFENSNLPFTVDLVSWDRCSDDFKKRIENQLIKVE